MKALEFIEMNKRFILDYRKQCAESVQRNRHMNEIEDGEILQQRHIDAILVDLINFIGIKHGIDYALYTSDLTQTELTLSNP